MAAVVRLYGPAIVLSVWAVVAAATGEALTPAFLTLLAVAVIVTVRDLARRYERGVGGPRGVGGSRGR